MLSLGVNTQPDSSGWRIRSGREPMAGDDVFFLMLNMKLSRGDLSNCFAASHFLGFLFPRSLFRLAFFRVVCTSTDWDARYMVSQGLKCMPHAF